MASAARIIMLTSNGAAYFFAMFSFGRIKSVCAVSPSRSELHMRYDFLDHAFVQFGIVPPAVNVVADEPTHGAARHTIAVEMLLGR
jgi:hypothetical protein